LRGETGTISASPTREGPPVIRAEARPVSTPNNLADLGAGGRWQFQLCCGFVVEHRRAVYYAVAFFMKGSFRARRPVTENDRCTRAYTARPILYAWRSQLRHGIAHLEVRVAAEHDAGGRPAPTARREPRDRPIRLSITGSRAPTPALRPFRATPLAPLSSASDNPGRSRVEEIPCRPAIPAASCTSLGAPGKHVCFVHDRSSRKTGAGRTRSEVRSEVTQHSMNRPSRRDANRQPLQGSFLAPERLVPYHATAISARSRATSISDR
jgi:hypothetical protein